MLNGDLGRAVAAHGLRYTPDPGSREISSIGGNIATNAGGMSCCKYGVTADHVAALPPSCPTAPWSAPAPRPARTSPAST